MSTLEMIVGGIAMVGALTIATEVSSHYVGEYFKRRAEQYIDKISSDYTANTSKTDLKKYLRRLETSLYHAGDEKAKKAEKIIGNIKDLLEESSANKPTETQKVVSIDDLYLKYGTKDK